MNFEKEYDAFFLQELWTPLSLYRAKAIISSVVPKNLSCLTSVYEYIIPDGHTMPLGNCNFVSKTPVEKWGLLGYFAKNNFYVLDLQISCIKQDKMS